MTFEELLDRMYGYDTEVFTKLTLHVFTNYRTGVTTYFRNPCPEDLENFIRQHNPILVTYNGKHYDKYILKANLLGYATEQIKEINDFIIDDNNPWEYPYEGYCSLPPIIDCMDDIVPRKSLKELEINMFMNVEETSVPFTKTDEFNEQEFEEVLHYCKHDVKATLELFGRRLDYFEAKYTICRMGNINPEYGLGYTNAKLTSVFLQAEYQEHNDVRNYKFPSNFELEKLLPEVKEYFDSYVNGDIDITRTKLPLKIDEMEGVVANGGAHFAINNYYFESEELKEWNFYE